MSIVIYSLTDVYREKYILISNYNQDGKMIFREDELGSTRGLMEP